MGKSEETRCCVLKWLRDEASGGTNNFRFVGNLGYYNESALALQYLRARYYQPGSGRFMTLDAAREDTNRYAYVRNNPLVATDPTGLKSDVGLPLMDQARHRYSKEYKEPKRTITLPAPQSPFYFMLDDLAAIIWATGAQAKALWNGWWVAFWTWDHWVSGLGRTRTLNIDKMVADNPEMEDQFKKEARHVYEEVKRLGLGSGEHRLISEEFRVQAPSSPDWNLALGTYYGYGIADVCVAPGRVTIDLTVWRWDPFEFNCNYLPYRPPGSIGHAHTSGTVTDYVNEAKQTGKFEFDR